MASNWYVKKGEKVLGPLDSPRLKQLAADKKIGPQTQVAQSSTGPWVSASRVNGLFAQPEPHTIAVTKEPQALQESGDFTPQKVLASPTQEVSMQSTSHLEQGLIRQKINTYFTSLGIGCAYFALVLGAVFLLTAFTKGDPQVFSGSLTISLFMVFAAAGVFHMRKGRPTDAAMDEWLAHDLDNLTALSLSKVGLQKSALTRQSVVVTGPTVWKIKDVAKHSKVGDDKILRYTPVAVTVIHFTKDQLVAYSCVLDLLTGKPHRESTDEFFYRDIVAVQTKKEAKKMEVDGVPLDMKAAETFSITTSGGNTLSVFLTDPTLVAKMGGGEISTARAEQALAVVRSVVRENKSG